ncbi:MAG: hypothetical protein GY800_12175 [Planctomycetes bacterium]|nr:hypothetical protein [Planctomycetota bacterium]
MKDSDIDRIIMAAFDRFSENLADKLIERIGTRFSRAILQDAGECASPDILSEEEALYKWKKALPEGAGFDKGVDLNLIVSMYPLSGSEIDGAMARAYKSAIGSAPGMPVQKRSKPRGKKIMIRDTDIRAGIVWALGDKVLLKRINVINKEEEEGKVCKLDHWCKQHPDDKNYDCWKEEKKFEGVVSSFCEPVEGVTGFKCPTNVGFDCNTVFECFDGGKFVFDCNGEGKKKFICSSNRFDCEEPGGGKGDHTFKCWVGRDFDCKPMNRPDVYICKPKEKEFKCPEKVTFEDKKPKPPCPKHPHVVP